VPRKGGQQDGSSVEVVAGVPRGSGSHVPRERRVDRGGRASAGARAGDVSPLGAREDEVERGQRDGTTREEHAEIVKLRREVRRLEEEKLILQKAAAYFARETGRLP